MTKEKVEAYLKNNEIDVQNANASFIVADLVYGTYVDSEKIHGIKYTPLCCYFFGDSSNFYQLLDKAHVRAVAKKVYDDYLADHKSLDNKIEIHESLANEIDQIWQEYEAIIEPKSADILQTLEKFLDKSREWWMYAVVGEDKGAVISEEVVPNFEKRHQLSRIDAQQIVSVLSHPKEQSILNQERKQFLELCIDLSIKPGVIKSISQKEYSSIMADENLSKKINTYIENNFWIKTDFCVAKKITVETVLADVLREVENKTEIEIRSDICSIEENLVKINSEQVETRNRLMLSADDEADLYFSQRTAYWIDRRKLGMMKQIYYLLTLVNDTVKISGVPFEEIASYSLTGLAELLKTGKRKDCAFDKSGGFVVYETGKPFNFFYGEEGKQLLTLAKHVEVGSSLKGMVASRGSEKLVEGTVKNVSDPQTDSFNQGDILVTSMTRIEFVPLMRKARAIITNEGGIACHTAIVSRELGIPCIIGTKVATEKLKDGDQVVMDMEKGTILLKI